MKVEMWLDVEVEVVVQEGQHVNMRSDFFICGCRTFPFLRCANIITGDSSVLESNTRGVGTDGEPWKPRQIHT